MALTDQGPTHRADADPANGRGNAITRFRTRIRRLPGGTLAWRIAVTVAGIAIIVGGIILLPLPGPGWLIIFAGLGVLATEYAWAARLLRWTRAQVQRWTDWLRDLPRWQRYAVVAVTALFVVGVIIGVYALYLAL